MRLLTLLPSILLAGTALAQVPQTLHHQGRIAVQGVNFDGGGRFKFLLYQGKNPGEPATLLWKNDNSAPVDFTEPASIVGSIVTKGLYSIALGEPPQSPITADLTPQGSTFHTYLRIWFDDGTHGSQLLSPDRRIDSVAFARYAAHAATVANGSVTAASLAPSLSIPNVQSGVYQTPFDPNFWVNTPSSYSVSFPSAYPAPPVVTANPGVSSPAPRSDITGAGFSGSVEVPPGTWSSTVAASATSPISIAAIDGRPAIAFGQSFPDPLNFAINANADGSGNWTTTMVANSSSPNGCSLCSISAKPAIAFFGGGALQFTINSAADGSGTWSQSTVDASASGTLQSRSLLEVDGRPAISYFDTNTLALRFAINSAADGSGVWSIATVDTLASSGTIQDSLAIVDGRPAIAYRDSVDDSIDFAINSMPDATGAWTISQITAQPSSLRHLSKPSLAIIDGKPAISYQLTNTFSSPLERDHYFWINSQAGGSGTWSLSLVVRDAGSHSTPSLVVADGIPMIALIESSQLTLRTDLTGSGTGDWHPTTIDPTANSTDLATATVGSLPMIAYRQYNTLRFWRPQPVDIHWIAVGQ